MIRKNNIILPKWNEKRAKLQEGQIDPLTKTIKNRPFRALAEEYLEEGQLLCYFNIVDFKLFNYRFGFEEGDLLLVEMANILKTAFPDALITRMFADQFAVLLSNADCYDALIQVHEAFSNLDLPMALDFKVGIYVFPRNEISSMPATGRRQLVTASKKSGKSFTVIMMKN